MRKKDKKSAPKKTKFTEKNNTLKTVINHTKIKEKNYFKL